ncbi:hypothetical protein K461DRAFT_224476 [Myriangium duriaei CBS 260.36]|uniref:G-protein coupled receptors family 1 profile domain-containing protein n=1 Tax=Myriangium duriaei CBS 260.36 TaxID=1168546 RepID=A0A9P4MHW5_9PEZI|nr:hypothetical protein K461DRAFT_224476 [Myriangium duriaei CBS 260.36]
MTLNLAAQIPTLIGSVMSCLATFGVLIVIIVNWSKRHSLRHVLIANLIFSDFANSLNNTISGIYILAHGKIPTRATSACIANGFIGQFTVQATDFSVLAMAISTLIIVTRPTVTSDSTTLTKIMATIGIWTFPLISSSTVAGLHAFGPVSGNWCWIVPQRNDLRYGLAHGIRYAIIVATVILYGIVFRIVREKLASTIGSSTGQYGAQSNIHIATIQGGGEEPTPIESEIEMANLINKQTMVTISVDQKSKDEEKAVRPGISSQRRNATMSTDNSAKKLRKQNKQNVARIMLMKAYPFAYVLLWLPGIANRLAELAGHPQQVLVILQASTQFIGFVDAVLYIIQWKVLKRD